MSNIDKEKPDFSVISKESLDELKKDQVVQLALRLYNDMLEHKKEYERMENEAAKDRRIAKQMEGTVKMLHEMTQEFGEMYKGLYELVKENFSASSVALKSLSQHLDNENSISLRNKMCNKIMFDEECAYAEYKKIIPDPKDPLGYDHDEAEKLRKDFEMDG